MYFEKVIGQVVWVISLGNNPFCCKTTNTDCYRINTKYHIFVVKKLTNNIEANLVLNCLTGFRNSFY